MESKDQVSASDKSVSGLVKGIEMQIRDNFDTLPSVRHDSGSVTEHLEEIKHASDEVGCMPTNDKDTDISSTESSNVFAEAKLEVARDESRNVPVEKEVSSCLLTESSNMSANEEKSDTIPVKVGDISQEKDLSQAKCSEALTGGEKFDTTSIESSYENVVFIEARRTDILASCDNLNEQSSDGGNSGIASEVSQLKALRSLCVMQKETGNLQVDADPINEEIETNGNGESISPDKLQTSSRADETACNESVTIKQTAGDLETTALKNSNNGTAGTTEISSEVNVMDKKSSIPSEIACEENITCITSGPTTKKPNYAYLVSKGSADIRSHSSVKVRHETVGGNVTKENSSIAAKAENLHLKRDEKDTNEQLPTDETAVCETVSNETANVGTSEADPQPGESEDDSERRAFFYMSSCSVPGMGKGWEWPTISSEHHYQRIPRRGECLRNAAIHLKKKLYNVQRSLKYEGKLNAVRYNFHNEDDGICVQRDKQISELLATNCYKCKSFSWGLNKDVTFRGKYIGFNRSAKRMNGSYETVYKAETLNTSNGVERKLSNELLEYLSSKKQSDIFYQLTKSFDAVANETFESQKLSSYLEESSFVTFTKWEDQTSQFQNYIGFKDISSNAQFVFKNQPETGINENIVYMFDKDIQKNNYFHLSPSFKSELFKDPYFCKSLCEDESMELAVETLVTGEQPKRSKTEIFDFELTSFATLLLIDDLNSDIQQSYKFLKAEEPETVTDDVKVSDNQYWLKIPMKRSNSKLSKKRCEPIIFKNPETALKNEPDIQNWDRLKPSSALVSASSGNESTLLLTNSKTCRTSEIALREITFMKELPTILIENTFISETLAESENSWYPG